MSTPTPPQSLDPAVNWFGWTDILDRARLWLNGDRRHPGDEAYLITGLLVAAEGAKHQAEEIAHLKSQLSVHRDKARGDYWCWQGDGTDNLETLVCPVQIRPEALAPMVAAAEERGRLKVERDLLRVQVDYWIDVAESRAHLMAAALADRDAAVAERDRLQARIPKKVEPEDVAQLYCDHDDLQRLIDATIGETLSTVAAQLGVKVFDAGDGSEDFWGDVGGSVINLLAEAGIEAPCNLAERMKALTAERDRLREELWQLKRPQMGLPIDADPKALKQANPVAWALRIAGKIGRNDFYLNKTVAENDARGLGYEVVPLYGFDFPSLASAAIGMAEEAAASEKTLREERDRLREARLRAVNAMNAAEQRAAEAEKEASRMKKVLADWTYSNGRVPEGAKRRDAYLHNGELIVLGDPWDMEPPEAECDDDRPQAHNCDAMGCGGVGHVILRTPAPAVLSPNETPIKIRAKGEFGGPCNRTACQASPATHWNSSTRAHYCGKCAAAINSFNPGLCTLAESSENPVPTESESAK